MKKYGTENFINQNVLLIMYSKTRLIILALLLTIGLLISYFIYSHSIVNVSYYIDNLTVTKKIFCTMQYYNSSNRSFSYDECYKKLDILIQNLYSYDGYYKIDSIYIVPGIWQTIGSTSKVFLANPIILVTVLITVMAVQLYSTDLGNFILILMLGAACFSVILLILVKVTKRLSEKNDQQIPNNNEQVILDLENSGTFVELESRV